MKTWLVTLAAAVLMAACSSSPSNNTNPGRKNFKYGTGDGQTMATAVEIRTRSDFDGGVMIKEWIRANYPGYAITEQELIEQRDKAYNMITIIGANNTSHRVYFDISMYYKRYGNPEFPKPPM
jgi:hypothetical protein